MQVHPSFEIFYIKVIVPETKYIRFSRLDGKEKGGNPAPFAYFRYSGSTWQINCDSHLYRIKEAYDSFYKGEDPFKVLVSAKGKRQCLELKKRTGFKHIYIYQVQ